MATSRLKIYNSALLLCGERSIASLTVNEEGRRLLDDVWNDGGVQFCLERGQWKFAMRGTEMTSDPDVTPAFGYNFAFPKPTDWVNTSAVCTDEYFKVPLLQYADEISYWFAPISTIYVKYVSNADGYGNNLAAWPASFTEYVKAYFASRIVWKLTGSKDKQAHVHKECKDRLLTAKNSDAMAGPTTFPARGAWARARDGAYGNGRRDRGNPGSLIG